MAEKKQTKMWQNFITVGVLGESCVSYTSSIYVTVIVCCISMIQNFKLEVSRVEAFVCTLTQERKNWERERERDACGSSPELAQKSLRPESCKASNAGVESRDISLLDHEHPLLQNAIRASLCVCFGEGRRTHTHTHTRLNDLTNSLKFQKFHRFFPLATEDWKILLERMSHWFGKLTR
jgi:hypothetical protein